MAEIRSRITKRYWAGILALLVVVLIWVSSSFVVNDIFADLHYNKPFFLTYLNTATFSFYLIPLLFKRRRQSATFSPEDINLETEERLLGDADISDAVDRGSSSVTKMSTKDVIKLSLIFCLIWFLANYTTNASLAYTTVASNTILSSTSGLFTLTLGAIFKVEKLTIIKVISVLVSFGGVVLVSYSDQASNTNNTAVLTSPLIGDLLALFGALFYGCYTTFVKLKIGDESRIHMPTFFGFVGLFNVLLLWPLFIVLHFLDIERFELPYSSSIWLMLILNAFIGTFLSDYLWLLSMLMTSPLVVTLGISLTIPFALVGDLVFKHIIPGLKYIVGALLVIIGFCAVNIAALSDVNKDNFAPPESDDEEIVYNTEEEQIRMSGVFDRRESSDPIVPSSR